MQSDGERSRPHSSYVLPVCAVFIERVGRDPAGAFTAEYGSPDFSRLLGDAFGCTCSGATSIASRLMD